MVTLEAPKEVIPLPLEAPKEVIPLPLEAPKEVIPLPLEAPTLRRRFHLALGATPRHIKALGLPRVYNEKMIPALNGRHELILHCGWFLCRPVGHARQLKEQNMSSSNLRISFLAPEWAASP